MTEVTHSLLALQMTSSPDVEENLSQAEALIDKALSSTRVDLIVLPEMFAQFGVRDTTPLARGERHFDGPVGQWAKQQAQKHDAWLVAGTVPVLTEEDSRPRARCHLISPQGEVAAIYDKIHLFDAAVGDAQGQYRESDSYSPGSNVVVVETPFGKLGLAVCYDLRFPEMFRALNDAGAELVVVPSAFTAKTGAAHWEVLCRARAIENGYFVAAVNQTGQHDEKRATFGHSMMIDPWGSALDLGEAKQAALFTWEPSRVEQVRKQIPVNEHRRLKNANCSTPIC